MAYVHSVELATPNKRFKHNAKPSLLQSKVKDKRNRYVLSQATVQESKVKGTGNISDHQSGTCAKEEASKAR
jgi:hypothetical protein